MTETTVTVIPDLIEHEGRAWCSICETSWPRWPGFDLYREWRAHLRYEHDLGPRTGPASFQEAPT